MAILTSYTEQEFKAVLKTALAELLAELPTQKNSQPEIMNIKQAAAFLTLEVNTLYEKTSKKLIPHFKKGGKLYFDRAELEDWLRAGKVKTVDEIQAEIKTEALNKNFKNAA